MEESRPRYGSLLAAYVVCLLIAGVAGFAGLVGGAPFAATEPEPIVAWVGWGIAGLALAAPIAGLPALGFRVRPVVAVTVAILLAVAVAVGGYLFTMKDVH